MQNLEKRVVTVELRKDEPNKIQGYAVVFNSNSELIRASANDPGFIERIAPGAFDRTIKEFAEKNKPIKALVNHDEALILGHTLNNRLKLTPDETGLAIEINPSDTSYARDLIVNLRDENASKMSFAFIATVEDWSEEDGQDYRTIKDADLYEVSVLQGLDPAYPATQVGLRMFAEWRAVKTAKEVTQETEVTKEVEAPPVIEAPKKKPFNSYDLLQTQKELELN